MSSKKYVCYVLTSILGAGGVGGLSACGMVQNMEEMHDDTRKVSQVSDEMNQGMKEQLRISGKLNRSTEDLSEMTRDLRNTSTSIYKDHRQGDAVTIRDERLARMESVSSQIKKISEAGIYFMSFEFQLYKDLGADTPARLEILYKDAMEEVFRDILNYSNGGYAIDPASDDGNMKNLFALAVTLHRINPNVEALNAAHGLRNVSVLTLFEDALARKEAIESGRIPRSEVAPSEHVILSYEDTVVYMLQLRSTFLATMALDRLTQLSSLNKVQKLWRLLKRYPVDLRKPNLEALETYTIWLKESLRVRDELERLGYPTRIDGNILTLYRKMNLVRTQLTPDSSPTARLHAEAEEAIVRAIEEFR